MTHTITMAGDGPGLPGYGDRHARAEAAAERWKGRRSLSALERGAVRATLALHGSFLPTGTRARLVKLAGSIDIDQTTQPEGAE